jgi:hypothetical protein
MRNTSVKIFRRADLILILIVAAIIAAAAMILAGHQMLALPGGSSGSQVEITQDGETTHLPLSQDTTMVLSSDSGGTNTLVVKNGEVWISEADCPDQICVKMGSISRTGQTIVCMPHQLVIRIISEDQEIDGEVQ